MLVVIALLYPASDTSLPWIRTGALVVFLFAALTDWLDGWLAEVVGAYHSKSQYIPMLLDILQLQAPSSTLSLLI